MADIADIAQSEENQDRDAAIRAALAPPAGCEVAPRWQDGLAYCRECETLIPEKHLKAVPETGVCVSCATELQEARASSKRIDTRDFHYILPPPGPAFGPAFELA